ncbi:MAG: hypothetical protein WC869_14115 [Phycisphaerae bacterium]|jgi:uncharacterized protein RhaS with RHS repeats
MNSLPPSGPTTSWWATIYSADGDKAIATQKNGSLYYFARDRLGSTRALVNTGGSIVEMYHYSAFGAVYNVDANGVDTAHTSGGLTAVLYTGQVWDAESRLPKAGCTTIATATTIPAWGASWPATPPATATG